MGYLIAGHVFCEKPEVSRLAEVPKSIGFNLYWHRTANVYLLDTFRASKTPRYPFQTLLPAVDIPLELPPPYEILNRLFDQLVRLQLGNSFNTCYFNFALLLRRLLQLPVLSFATDDDDLDLTCLVSEGDLRLKCRCADLLIYFENHRLTIAPLMPEEEFDDAQLTDVKPLQSA